MIIGEKSYMAFEFAGPNTSNQLKSLRFYLGNKLMTNEPVEPLTYTSALQRFLDLLNERRFENPRLNCLSPVDIMRKLMGERESNEYQFFKHLFQLDETIDKYQIFVVQSNKSTDFVWMCWDLNNCNSWHEHNQIYSVTIPTLTLVSILNKLIARFKK